MTHRIFMIAPLVAVLALAACGGETAAPSSAAPSSPAASSAKPAASSAPASPASSAAAPASAAAAPASASAAPASAAAAASGSASAAAKPSASAAPPPTFAEGPVKSLDGDKLTLNDGQTFTIAANTGYQKLTKVNGGDIKAGQFLAITAKLQGDGTLLATNIRISDVNPSAPPPNVSQFPMPGQFNGNLMTNAIAKTTDANGAVVTLNGQDVTIKYAPNAELLKSGPGTKDDLKPGANAYIISRDGAAIAVGIIA